MKNYMMIIIFALVVVIWGMSRSIHQLQGERDTYKANQAALLSKVEYYKTENGKSAASVARLQLTNDELVENYDSLKKTADELGIKVKRMQSASTTATQTNVQIVTQVRDSVIYRDSRADSLKYFVWADPWLTVEGNVRKDSVAVDVESRDTLIQIVHRVPHKFWFIKWGTKAVRQEVVSTNPHTTITYNEYIELK